MAGFDLKNYIDVQERINTFWADHPDGAIRTRLDSDPSDFTVCRYRAEVYKQRDSTAPDATGYAFESAGGGGANRTSHEENCETSAIGRALANMGYAKDRDDRPSKQEMAKVERGPQPAPQRATRPPAAPNPANAMPPASADRDALLTRLRDKAPDDVLEAIARVWRFLSFAELPVEKLQELDALLDGAHSSKERQANFNAWKFKYDADRAASQAQLMPTPAEVPDPNRHTR